MYHVIELCGRVIIVEVASCIQKHLECFQVVVVGRHTKETDVLVSLIVVTVKNVTKLRALVEKENLNNQESSLFVDLINGFRV